MLMKLIPGGDDDDTRDVGRRDRECEPDSDIRVHPRVVTGGNPVRVKAARLSLGFRFQCNL